MLNNIKFKDVSSKFLNYIIYGLFFLYLLYLIFTSNTIATKLVFSLILIFFGSFAILNEYLKSIYKEAIVFLTVECNPLKGKESIKKLERLDIFKSYKKAIYVFNLLLLKDEGDFNGIIEYLDKVTINPFKTSYDLLLVYYYSLFFAYSSLNDEKNSKKYYYKVINLKDKKILNKKISPLFSWEEIKGLYKFTTKKYSDAYTAYSRVNKSAMNKRELVHFNLLVAKLEISNNKKNDAKKYLNFIIDNGNKMAAVSEAKNLLQSM